MFENKFVVNKYNIFETYILETHNTTYPSNVLVIQNHNLMLYTI